VKKGFLHKFKIKKLPYCIFGKNIWANQKESKSDKEEGSQPVVM